MAMWSSRRNRLPRLRWRGSGQGRASGLPHHRCWSVRWMRERRGRTSDPAVVGYEARRRGCDRRRNPESNHRRGTWIQIAAGHCLRTPLSAALTEEVFTSLSQKNTGQKVSGRCCCALAPSRLLPAAGRLTIHCSLGCLAVAAPENRFRVFIVIFCLSAIYELEQLI
jgi:hypothetical protein